MVPPKSKLGQNFLRDEQAIRRIVAALGDCSVRTIVEIGPGRGAITRELAAKAGRVVALEVDSALAAELSGDFSRSDSGHGATVRIENVDVLAFDFRAASGAAGQRLLVAGNLPYYITSPILSKLAENADVLDRAVLMVQREVADRVTAKPGNRDYGLLSVTVQLHGAVTPLFTLPPSAFSPPPDVHSTVFRWQFAPRFEELGIRREDFLAFLRRAFALKRKTIANNLRAAGMETGTIAAVLARAGVEAKSRAEALPIETLAAVWREIQREGAIPLGEMAPMDQPDL
jgi:16S rRNA (adenine1518-N6/adenine1519-N6)-dimethyltransferase